MKNILGIWTNDINYEELREIGFNAIFLPVYPFWVEADKMDIDYSLKQKLTAEVMYSEYLRLKQLGFSFFLIDFGWGLGAFDNNYFYEKIYNRFKNDDILFYFGEPIEQLVEDRKYEYYDVKKIIDERFSLAGEQLLLDSTTRNIEQLRKDFPYIKTAISSYYNQHKYWVKGQALSWIYGQLKIGGSLCYKKLSSAADEKGITIRFLYQGDDGVFKFSIPFTWFNSLLRLIGLDKRFKKWQQRRFIKHFR